jgi:hypothetical protein
MFLYGITTVGKDFYLGQIPGSFGTMFIPAVRGILSQSMAPELLGATLGTLAMFESMSVIIAPLAIVWIYGKTLGDWPTAVFYTLGILTLAGVALILFVYLNHIKARRQRQV